MSKALFVTTRAHSSPTANIVENENNASKPLANKPSSLLLRAPWSSGCLGTMFRPRMEQSWALLRMMKAEAPNLSLKDPSLTAQADPSMRGDATTGQRLAGRARSLMAHVKLARSASKLWENIQVEARGAQVWRSQKRGGKHAGHEEK